MGPRWARAIGVGGGRCDCSYRDHAPQAQTPTTPSRAAADDTIDGRLNRSANRRNCITSLFGAGHSFCGVATSIDTNDAGRICHKLCRDGCRMRTASTVTVYGQQQRRRARASRPEGRNKSCLQAGLREGAFSRRPPPPRRWSQCHMSAARTPQANSRSDFGITGCRPPMPRAPR